MANANQTTETVMAKTNKGKSAVGSWMRGESEPDLPTMEKLAALCGVAPGLIFFGETDPNQGDPEWGPLFARYKDNPMFAFAFCEAATLLTGEGFEVNFAYLVSFTTKVLRAAESMKGDDRLEQKIRATVDAERAKIRAQKDDTLKSLL